MKGTGEKMVLLQLSGLLKIKSLHLLKLYVLGTVYDLLLLLSYFQINDLMVFFYFFRKWQNACICNSNDSLCAAVAKIK